MISFFIYLRFTFTGKQDNFNNKYDDVSTTNQLRRNVTTIIMDR